MSNKSIIATLLIVGGVILHLVVVWSRLNIDLRNPEHIAQAIGMALAYIILSAGVGLVVGFIVHLYLKKRTRSNFFLVFSVFFLATSFMIANLMSENLKSEETGKDTVIQELSSPYVSTIQDFTVAFPTKPEIAQNDYSSHGIEGNVTVYISTKYISGQEVIYYVIVNNTRALAFMDDNGRRNYYEQFPIVLLANAGAKVTKISSTIKDVYDSIEGVEYKYRLEADNKTFYKRGIDFIKDSNGYQISIIYPSDLEGRIEEIYFNFISSFSLLSQ